MKALFVGLGSIGRRHLLNLSALCQAQNLPLDVWALRATSAPLPLEIETLISHQLGSLPEGEGFDVAFITNPTHLHAVMLGELKDKVGCFFIEKPIFEHTGYNLELLGLTPQQKAYVAAPMRWTALYTAVKELLQTKAPYAVRAICSSYLPSWRADTDYRTVYSAKREMGGGVTLDLIHEWDYLCDLFGPPLECYNLKGQYSKLEIDSDDISVYIARWQTLLGELHLDYFGRGYRRQLELMCEAGSYVADFGTGQLQLPGGQLHSYAEDANRRYQREMEYFITYAQTGKGESINSPCHALNVLKIALGETNTCQQN